VAHELGMAHWDARHTSAAFKLTRPFALTVMGNAMAVWNRERMGIGLSRGVDEVSLALVADAWSRTYRSRAVAFAAAPGAVETRSGLRVLPDALATEWPVERRLPALDNRPPARALHETLTAIERRYGGATADVVAMQLELVRPPAPQSTSGS
jgi:hypothetical protein